LLSLGTLLQTPIAQLTHEDIDEQQPLIAGIASGHRNFNEVRKTLTLTIYMSL
jgi:hypothetical protein